MDSNCQSQTTKNRRACALTRAGGLLYTIKLNSACRAPDPSLAGLDPVPLSKLAFLPSLGAKGKIGTLLLGSEMPVPISCSRIVNSLRKSCRFAPSFPVAASELSQLPHSIPWPTPRTIPSVVPLPLVKLHLLSHCFPSPPSPPRTLLLPLYPLLSNLPSVAWMWQRQLHSSDARTPAPTSHSSSTFVHERRRGVILYYRNQRGSKRGGEAAIQHQSAFNSTLSALFRLLPVQDRWSMQSVLVFSVRSIKTLAVSQGSAPPSLTATQARTSAVRATFAKKRGLEWQRLVCRRRNQLAFDSVVFQRQDTAGQELWHLLNEEDKFSNAGIMFILQPLIEQNGPQAECYARQEML